MHRPSGFSRIELTVAVVIGLVLFAVIGALAFSYIQKAMTRRQMMSTLSNMKQLHLAASQMAEDGITEHNTNLAWPGDLGGDYSRWMAVLVPDYIMTNQIRSMLSAPGRIVPRGGIPSLSDSAILFYAVRSNSPANTVFLSTANFNNSPTGGTLDPKAKPYGKFGFVIFHRGGTGAILWARQAGKTNFIGSFAPLCH